MALLSGRVISYLRSNYYSAICIKLTPPFLVVKSAMVWPEISNVRITPVSDLFSMAEGTAYCLRTVSAVFSQRRALVPLVSCTAALLLRLPYVINTNLLKHSSRNMPEDPLLRSAPGILDVPFWLKAKAGDCLSLIHIWRCRRLLTCRSRWSPYH